MKITSICTLALALTALLTQPSFAQTLYYDTNGATPGTNTSSTQNFTDPVWTTDSTGSITTTGYTPGSDVIFSATDGVNVGTGTQNVTVSNAESADSFTFNNGIVTLFGSGAPNLSIGAGGITVNSTDGVTTFDSSLGTVTLSSSQSWNNNTSLAFDVNSSVTGSGQTLSFNGSGVASNVGITSTNLNGVNLNGQITGTVNLTQNSAGSPLMLNNTNNNFTGNITANGGIIVGQTPGSFGNGGNTIFLNNGGTLGVGQDSFSVGAVGNNIVLGTGGGQIYAGVPGVSGTDIVLNGTITGGTGLTVLSGDFLPNSATGAGDNVGTLNVTGGRLLAFQNGIFDNNAVVNVSSGAVLDFSQGATLNNTINLADGSALENRSGGMSLTDVVLPTGNATVTLGADDVGSGSITVNGPAINLANGTTLTLDINENHTSSPFNTDTTVFLDENITGSGTLTLTLIPGVFNEGTVVLNGNNNYSGPTTLNGVTVYPGSTGFGTSTVTMNDATINLTGGTLSNPFILGTQFSNFNLISNTSQVLSGLISTTSAGGEFFVTNSSSTGSLTVGSMNFPTETGGGAVLFDENGPNTSITLNGTYTSTTGVGGSNTFLFGARSGDGSANYYIAPTADFSGFQTFNYQGPAALGLIAGNLHLDNSSFIPGQFISTTGSPDVNQTIDLVGAQNIQATLYDSMKNEGSVRTGDGLSINGRSVINQSTQDISTWSGQIILDGTNITLSAVAGGRLNVADLTGGAPEGIDIAGNGVVVLSGAGGNSFNEMEGGGNFNPVSTVAADLQSGSTTLITNTSGSAFGTDSNQGNNFYNNPGTYNGTVNVEAGATLGGSGFTTQNIVAIGATSVIAPGDPGQANLGILPSIGILHLNIDPATETGGLTATSGLTLDFKLDGDATQPGTNSDLLVADNLTLGGTVTVNITNLGGPVDTTLPYTLIKGDGTWTGNPDLVFDINAPAGYALDMSYGTDGYLFDTDFDRFTVEFVETPEPSTYGLLGLGLLALVAIRRFRRLTA